MSGGEAEIVQDMRSYNVARAIGVTVLACGATLAHFAPGSLGMKHSGNGWFALLYWLWAGGCWPIVLSRALQQYHAQEKLGIKPRKAPFSYWFSNFCAIAMLTILVVGFVYSLVAGK